MSHTNLLVVDIETVPDRVHHEGDAFPKLPFHQVVAIAFVEAAIERDEQVESFRLREVRSGGEVGYTERQLIEGFFQYFERLKRGWSLSTVAPSICRSCGTERWRTLALSERWAIQQLSLERGLNALWIDGGLMYAPPLR